MDVFYSSSAPNGVVLSSDTHHRSKFNFLALPA
jgi:hypothetical protein